MAGYDGYSMSNNARAAYEGGAMPKSKWTKALIIDGIAEEYGEEIAEKARKHSANFLRDYFLTRSSWHHTGMYYARTDFYSIKYMGDEKALEVLSYEEEKEEKAPTTWKPCKAVWAEWTGTRKHRKAEDVSAFGRTDGSTFISADGWTRKKCTGKYFTLRIMEEKEAREAFREEFGLKTSHRYNKWLETGNIK